MLRTRNGFLPTLANCLPKFSHLGKDMEVDKAFYPGWAFTTLKVVVVGCGFGCGVPRRGLDSDILVVVVPPSSMLLLSPLLVA